MPSSIGRPADSTTPMSSYLHGYPTSSHMFRHLIPVLSDRYHLIAPDYVGFGFSDAPPVAELNYSFDALGGHHLRPAQSHRRRPLRHVRAGLRRPGGMETRAQPPGARHGDHQPERQCLRRGLRRVLLGSDLGLRIGARSGTEGPVRDGLSSTPSDGSTPTESPIPVW